MDNDISIATNPIVVNADIDNDGNSGTLEKMKQLLIKMINHHNHCRRHHIRIPEKMNHLEKRWHQTLPLLSQIIKDHNSATEKS